MPTDKPFFEIAAILGLATVLGIAGQKLRQPLIIMFLIAGVLAGPSGLGLIRHYGQIELLAQIGIALLLFIVGLKLDLHLIRTIGPVALATGLGQIVFTSVIGFFLTLALGLPPLESAYVAVALTFSSTIIIVKLLSDKKEIDSLHGQIAIGFLIIQDIAAILALVALTTIGGTARADTAVLHQALLVAGKGLGLLLAVALLMKFVLPPLTRRLAHSVELLSLFAIAWGVLLGAGGEWLGFSKEVGAFLGGVSLASTDFRDSVGVRLTALRDFLLLFFFIDLGARLDWSLVGAQLGASVVLSLFVLIGNPLIVLLIMGAMGYRRRTSFLAGLTVAQISEFSLILASLGLSLGHLRRETLGLITLVGVVTIFLSTYLILYSGPLYRLLAEPLKLFERRHPYREEATDTRGDRPPVDVVLLGLGNYGGGLAEYLLQRGWQVLGVDFDPGALARWRERGIQVVYGDVADPEMHEHLPLRQARWVISAIRSREVNLGLLQSLKRKGFGGRVALTAVSREEAAEFEKAGAHLVFRPFSDSAEQAADALTYAADFLPEQIDWPIAFLEVRIRSDSSAAGRTIRELGLRPATTTTILAASRGGRVFYDPEPDFQVFPGDRLLLMGPPDELIKAEHILNRLEVQRAEKETDRFELVEVRVAEGSSLAGRSLAELGFRQKFGVTVVGIRRGEEKITAVTPADRVQGGDWLVVIGTTGAVGRLKQLEPL